MPARFGLPLALTVLLLGLSAAAPSAPPMLPDPRLTPGDVLSTDTRSICTPGYTKTVRNVPTDLKRQVYKNYGLAKRPGEDWEVDHLIALELGGSNSLRNLWPEAGFTQPLNYHVKDRVENALHDLVCSGRLDIRVAQRAIASNWAKAYKDYLGNLPDGTDPSTVTAATSSNISAPGPVVNPPPSAPPSPPANPGTTANAKGVSPNPDGSCPSEAPVKVSRRGIYHEPQGDPNYAATHAVVCFATPGDAQAAGYRGPK